MGAGNDNPSGSYEYIWPVIGGNYRGWLNVYSSAPVAANAVHTGFYVSNRTASNYT